MRDTANSRQDRFMLVTFEEPPGCIKVLFFLSFFLLLVEDFEIEPFFFFFQSGWKENLAVFTEELKNLRATDLSDPGLALRVAFDLLNVHRLQSGIENYCQGRYTSFAEPAVVITFTDGTQLTSPAGVLDSVSSLFLPPSSSSYLDGNERFLGCCQLLIPPTSFPGSRLTAEPFRWDQRVLNIVFRNPKQSLVEHEIPVTLMAEVTGGKPPNATELCDPLVLM